MTDSEPEKPPRRPRYSGKNPRQFAEKYKEHQPDRYAEEVAKVLAAGKTPAGSHRPIMVREIMEGLAPQPGEIAVDCTLGHGGHARELLAAIGPTGRFIGLDSDPIELPRTEAALRSLGFPDETIVLRRVNFSGLAAVVAAEAPGGVDVVLADLGLSSMQIDDPARGFSYKADGPLDMRMNPSRGATAADLLARIDRASLARLLAENGDEPRADETATAILVAQARSPLTTTRSLVSAVRSIHRRADDADDAVRRVFQSLRIAVNEEFRSLDSLLHALPSALRSGGRVAILSFHSGEDRRVKAAFKDGFQDGVYRSISKEVLRASPDERRSNPRSSSAKLRFATRA